MGEKIGRLVGAAPGQVICADSTSVNLFKVLATALQMQERRPQLSMRERRVILSERGNFPTDPYMAQGLVELLGGHDEPQLVEFDDVPAALARLGERVAALLPTHVNFQTGEMHDMAALTIWDLAHSAGAVPVALDACRADFAVGCGYKYLNGGPGAPAFVYAAERHLQALAELPFAQPLSGWLGHRAPFEFSPQYAPAAGIARFTVGTPFTIALAALEVGVDTVLAVGVPALRDNRLLGTWRSDKERTVALGVPLDRSVRARSCRPIQKRIGPIALANMSQVTASAETGATGGAA